MEEEGFSETRCKETAFFSLFRLFFLISIHAAEYILGAELLGTIGHHFYV